MPLYEYRCQDCGQHVTLWRSFSATSPPTCSMCSGENLTRLILRVAVVKSQRERITDLSWVDRNLACRLKKKADTKLSPALQATLDRMDAD